MKANRIFPLASAALVLLVLAVYGQTAWHGFISYDDHSYVYDNLTVKAGLTLQGALWAFGYHVANWHPLTWLSHMLDVQLFGMRPGWHHLVNVLLHAANAVLLFAVLRSMTGACWRSLTVALLFAMHPLRVESVAWIAERKDVLSGFFWMLTMIAYVSYTRRRSIGRYLAILLLFALGLMAKPMLVTLPLVLLLLDWWPLGRLNFRSPARAIPALLLEKVPLLALSAIAGIFTWQAQSTGLTEKIHPDLPARLANTLISYSVYLWKTIWPTSLGIFYPFPKDGYPAWAIAASAAFLLGVTVLAVGLAAKHPSLPVGWFWYLVTLVPVIGLVQAGSQARADRYTYLPLIGISIALVWWAADLFPTWKWRRMALGTSVLVTTVALAMTAGIQTTQWRDAATLYSHTIQVTHDNYRIMNNLATILPPEKAIPVLREALRASSGDATTAYNLGVVLLRTGRYQEALAWLTRALSSNPDDANAHYYAGMALMKTERYTEAAHHFREVLRITPGHRASRIELAKAYLNLGRLEESRKLMSGDN